MFRKYILILSALFGLSMIAETYAVGMSGDEASGFSGAFELKYKANLGDGGDKLGGFTYRAHSNWAGEVNSMIMWKLGIGTEIEQNFSSLDGVALNMEEAYVSYMPLDGFKIVVGKFGWNPSFAKTGVLYDEDHYPQGLMAKYHNDAFYVKVALVNLSNYTGPFSKSNTQVVVAKLGTKQDLGGVNVSAYVGAGYDGLLGDNADEEAVTLANAGVQVAVPDLAVPVNVTGVYGGNADDLFENYTYSVGVNVNEGDSMHNVSVGVNYYNVNETSWNTAVVNTDYIAPGENGNGVAARVQYNLWDNSNLVAKYAFNMEDGVDNPHNLIGELTFNF